MSDPMATDEWSSQMQPRNAESRHASPPRPEVVEVTDPDLSRRAAGAAEHEGYHPDDPIPPDEWGMRIQPRNAETRYVFPPRPEVIEVTEPDLSQRAAGAAGHEGYRPDDAPLNPIPQMLRPEQQRRPLWRRPPGQQDDMGEPTGPRE